MRRLVGRDVDRARDLLGGEIDNQNALPRVRVPVVHAVTVDGDVRGIQIRRDGEVVRRALTCGKAGQLFLSLRVEKPDELAALVDQDQALAAGGIVRVRGSDGDDLGQHERGGQETENSTSFHLNSSAQHFSTYFALSTFSFELSMSCRRSAAVLSWTTGGPPPRRPPPPAPRAISSGSPARLVLRVRIGAPLGEQLHHAIPAVDGHVQRGVAVAARGIDRRRRDRGAAAPPRQRAISVGTRMRGPSPRGAPSPWPAASISTVVPSASVDRRIGARRRAAARITSTSSVRAARISGVVPRPKLSVAPGSREILMGAAVELRVRIGAVREQPLRPRRPPSSVSRQIGAGRLCTHCSVLHSTAAYSAAMPVVSAMFGVGALLDQHRGQVEVGVDDREDQRRRADRDRLDLRTASVSATSVCGSATTLRSAPSSTSARAASSAPSRAAYISGVHPPRGNGMFGPPLFGNSSTGGSTERERALMSAPGEASARTTSGVVLGRRPHQRRLAEPRFARVDVGATRRSSCTRRDAARARGRHQDRLALRRCALSGARAGLEQHVDDRARCRCAPPARAA